MKKPKQQYGLSYNRSFISKEVRQEILDWLQTLHPIWEERYSKNNPPPEGQEQRQLLRPVYWLGNWQFACLDYYHPPKGILHRCVKAEPYPPVLQNLVNKIEEKVRLMYRPEDVPKKWHLNTCLVNFYGDRIEGAKKIDCARVGDHKDFEPGPVASISLGERAMFQFVTSRAIGKKDDIVLEQWLDDGSLQIFGGEKWKNQVFHRVQRVDKKGGFEFKFNVSNFITRRVNFTFRYVPTEHIVPYSKLPKKSADDVKPYMEELAKHSNFFKKELFHDERS